MTFYFGYENVELLFSGLVINSAGGKYHFSYRLTSVLTIVMYGEIILLELSHNSLSVVY